MTKNKENKTRKTRTKKKRTIPINNYNPPEKERGIITNPKEELIDLNKENKEEKNNPPEELKHPPEDLKKESKELNNAPEDLNNNYAPAEVDTQDICGGQGVVPPPSDHPLVNNRTTQQFIVRALEQSWPITPEHREAAIQWAHSCIDNPNASNRDKANAAKIIATADKLNLQRINMAIESQKQIIQPQTQNNVIITLPDNKRM